MGVHSAKNTKSIVSRVKHNRQIYKTAALAVEVTKLQDLESARAVLSTARNAYAQALRAALDA